MDLVVCHLLLAHVVLNGVLFLALVPGRLPAAAACCPEAREPWDDLGGVGMGLSNTSFSV